MNVNSSVDPCADIQRDPRVVPDTEPSNIPNVSQLPIQVNAVTVSLSISSVNSNFVSSVHSDSNASIDTTNNPSLDFSETLNLMQTIIRKQVLFHILVTTIYQV